MILTDLAKGMVFHKLMLFQDEKNQKSGLTSSKAFFSQLQEEVTSHIKSKTTEKRKKKAQGAVSGKKFKL